MRLIKPKAELIECGYSQDDVLKHIEKCGKVCYKSENTITEDSYVRFVARLIQSKHMSVLEHGTVYLTIPMNGNEASIDELILNPYTKIICPDAKSMYVYVTTNMRCMRENNWLEELGEYITPPYKEHIKRYTVKVTTDIGVTREINRHRHFSISEQSSRYCNYSQDKHGSEVKFLIPAYWDKLKASEQEDYERMLSKAEDNYFLMLRRGFKPEQAREVLPLATATEAVYTAFEDDWEHFFNLRLKETTGKVHPNMRELAEMIYKCIKNKDYGEN